MPSVTYRIYSLFEGKLIIANVKKFVIYLLVWSLFCGMICLPVIAKTQKQTQNNNDASLSSKKGNQTAEKYTASNYKNPISFEPNKGQTDSSVKYLAHGLGYNLFLTSNEAVMVFSKTVALDKKEAHRSINKIPTKLQSSVLRMQFVGANSNPNISSFGELPGKRNYLSNKQKIINLPNYKEVTYDKLYKGIGLTFYSNKQLLEYDFNVAPNTDVSAIRIKFEGAEKLNIAADGDLVLQVGGEEIRHKKPVIYQEVAGVKKNVEGRYVINDKNEVGFQLGQYDKSRNLVIDPIISFSTYLGGSGNDACEGLTVDKEGNVYVTGDTNSSNFPKTSGTITSSSPSDTNLQLFASKFDSSGQLVFSTYWGGSAAEAGADIQVDNSGNIYVIGFTNSSNYPTTPGAFQTVSNGLNFDSFATKLNSTGTAFIYSTFLGGTNNGEVALASALDDSGNLFLSGQTGSSDFPTTPGAFQTTLNGSVDGFITKLNSSGSALLYSTFLGGNEQPIGNSDVILDVTIDSAGNLYATGSTNATNFPTTNGAYQQTINGISDGFVTKLNSNGTALIYSTFLGGAGNGSDEGDGIITDSSGNAYIIGTTDSPSFPTTPGAFQTTSGGNYDAFITKLNSTGTALIYSTYLGGSQPELGFNINLDSANNAFVVGFSDSSNFPTTSEALQTTLKGNRDGFITKLNSTGTSLLYSTFFGGTGSDGIGSSYLSACGDFYFAGVTDSFDFPVRQAYQPTNRSASSDVIEGTITKLTFLSTISTAPDATADGSLPVTVSEYKLPAVVDTEVLDLTYNGDPLKIELWASIYRPATLSGSQYPLLVFLHGMHSVCERNSTSPPAGSPKLPATSLWYGILGVCDNPNTTTFDESPYYNVIQNHRGYDYLGQKLASWGYIVVSINVNRGIHATGGVSSPDPFLILPRGLMVLRHLQKLKEWNDCTTNPNCQTPVSIGADLRGKLDFGNIGLFGHSRGGQGVRAAYNIYRQSSVWQSRISGANIKGIFEVGPTDFETNSGVLPDPASKFIADGTKWNVILPMCDGDVITLAGMNPYDRMLALGDNPSTQKSTYAVWGTNHNFYNTNWTSTDGLCFNHDSIFNPTSNGSAEQRQTAITSVVAFFRANIGSGTNPNLNQNFNPLYDLPASINNITRVERGFTPSPNTNFTTIFEDFNTTNPNNCYSGTNTCTVGGAPNVSHTITKIEPYHDNSLNVLLVNWSSAGNDKFLQINWRPTGVGVNISNHDTFDFRITRNPNGTNVANSTNFSIQLVMANDDLSSPVKLCNYAKVDKSIGGYNPAISNYELRPLLQTVRVPLTAFNNANLSQVRGIKITFNESTVGSVFLANLRFTK